ncbi:MAG: cadherin-like beta sandwich domain-containing protein [Verrucomicrobiota bacterium]
MTTSGDLSGKGVTSVVAGYYHNLALCADGTVVAWGHNNSGQLGNNSIIDSNVPVNITASGALNGVSAITLAAGINHSLVLCEDGSLVSWGNNTNGQLGDGTTTSSLIPVSVYAYGVLAGQVVEKISAGGFHNLVACSDGTLVAFGMNTYGQLGNGGNTDSSMPVAVTLNGTLHGKTVTALQAANAHSLALCSDGSIASWGMGSNGLLGNGGSANSNVPVAVTASGIGSGEKFIALANGSSASHSMAITAIPLSSGSTLASLALSNGTMSPAFSAATLSYATSVPSSTPSITVTPTVTDATATVTVNGTLVASGSASALIPLAVGSNTITVVGIPQDGVALTTYALTATRAGSFDLWKSAVFTKPNDLSNPAVSGELATPANDGMSNLMKYAMALSPMASATGNLPTSSRQAGYLTLTYRKSKTASDVTYTVQASDSLSSNAWTPAATVLSQTDPTQGGGSYWLVTVRDNVPYATHPQRFMRLQVVK